MINLIRLLTASIIAVLLSACGGEAESVSGTSVFNPIINPNVPPPPAARQPRITAIFESNLTNTGWSYAIESSSESFSAQLESAKINNMRPDFIDVNYVDGRYLYTLILSENVERLNWAVRTADSANEFEETVAEMRERNFQPESVDADYINGEASISSIWIANHDAQNWNIAFHRNETGFQNLLQHSIDNSLTPMAVDIDLVGDTFIYGGFSKSTGAGWQFLPWRTQEEFQQVSADQRAIQRHPIYLDVDVDNSQIRYTSVWRDNIEGKAWHMIPFGNFEFFQEEAERLKSQNFKPVFIKTCGAADCSH